MFSFGNKALKAKQEEVDITKYGDNKASGDINEDLKKNKAALVKIFVEGGKVVAGIYDDTGPGTVVDKLGVFDVKEGNNTEEDNKVKTNLKNSDIASDPLTIGISKIIKKKIENNSTLDTSPEEIDAMMIKIMEDIEEEEKLIDNTEDDVVEEVDTIIDMVSNIEEILETNSKLADQKIIDLKSDLNRAESEKKYLEGIVKAHEDAEKEGGILGSAQGITSIRVRLENAEKTISDLKDRLQLHEDELREVADEENPGDQGAEDVLTDEEEPEEIIEEAAESIITLTGTMDAPDMDPQKMYMTIDPGAGLVSGILYLRINNEGIKLDIDTSDLGKYQFGNQENQC